MVRSQLLDGTLERLEELGSHAVKQTKKAGQTMVKKAVSDLTGGTFFDEEKKADKTQSTQRSNFSQLDPEQIGRLNKIYQHKDQDGEEIAKIKNRLNFFQAYKGIEKEAIQEIEQKKIQKERLETDRAYQKEQEKKSKATEPVVTPKGKVRRNIFQRAVKQSQPETRVGSGK